MPISTYDEVYACSQRDPEGFWAAAADDVTWFRRWDELKGEILRGTMKLGYPQGKT